MAAKRNTETCALVTEITLVTEIALAAEIAVLADLLYAVGA
jgi:hypothetical protein